MKRNPNPSQYLHGWYVIFFSATLLLIACRPDVEELQQEAIIQSYEEVQAQLADVAKEVQLLHKKYQTHKNPIIGSGEKSVKQRDISNLPISKGEAFSHNLSRFIEVLSTYLTRLATSRS